MAIIPKIDKSSNKEPEKHGVLNIFLPVIHYTALLSICIPEMYLILYVPCIDANSNIHIHPRYTLCSMQCSPSIHNHSCLQCIP